MELKNKKLPDDLSPLSFLHNQKILNENGRRMEFEDHKFLIDPMTDFTKEQVIMKPSQVGWTVAVGINKSFWLAKFMKANIIYTMPSRTAIKDFVSPKVDPIVAQNPIYKSWMGETNSAALKAVGDRFIFFRGSWEESAAISISADVLINDEVDRSNQKVLQTYRTRLDASARERPDLGFVWQWSNPSIPGYGVDEQWQISDQKHWFVKCPRCNYEMYMKFPDNIDFKKKIYICAKCHRHLSDEARRDGRWVIKHKDREISGYWLSQLVVPWIPAKDIIKKSEKDVAIFYNFCLGLPYISKDQSVDRQTITKCIEMTTNARTGVVMGIDNGIVKTVVIGNVHGIFKVYETESWEEIEADFVRYQATAVCDLNPYPNTPRKLAQKYSGRFFTCTFNEDQRGLGVIQWGKKDKRGTVLADRTKIVDMVVSELIDQEIVFNLTLKDLEQYIYDWGQLYRAIVTSAQGIKRAVWKTIEGRRDHFALTTIYWRIALEKVFAQGGVVRTPQKRQNSLIKKSVAVNPDGTVPASVDLDSLAAETIRKNKSWKTR